MKVRATSRVILNQSLCNCLLFMMYRCRLIVPNYSSLRSVHGTCFGPKICTWYQFYALRSVDKTYFGPFGSVGKPYIQQNP